MKIFVVVVVVVVLVGSREYSTQLNASRLRLLQAQDDLICKMKEGAEKQLQSVSSNGEKYCKLLEGFIVQVKIEHEFLGTAELVAL